MLHEIKNVLLGPPLPTQELAHERLNKVRALAAFSPDALSSIAYANQELYLGLVVAGSAGLSLAVPISLVIVGLLFLLSLSYSQVIHAYPSGGGSYQVVRENLGDLPGLVAVSALLIDYTLTVAVSLTSGVEAIASAFPILWSHRVAASFVLLAIIALLNLRGVRETGSAMAIPIYLFVVIYLSMLCYGVVRAFIEGPGNLAAVAPAAVAPLTPFLVLRSFSSGCTALTGIEAISDGVPAFRPPESRNASRTLIVMALLMGVLFVGSIGLTQFFAVIAGPEETILSALARRILGSGPAYLLVQFSTLLVLAVAANTSFSGFPRVAAVLARDRFLPHQLMGLGDRLVFVNGILILAGGAALLIAIFGGNAHALVPLFAVGAFLAFTTSQVGMVVHWWRERGRGWWLKAILNGLGGLATWVTLLVVSATKFSHGAWMTLLAIPALVIIFLRIRSHYVETARQLSLEGIGAISGTVPSLRIVVPISGVHRGVVKAMEYARALAKDVIAVYVELEPGSGEVIREKWNRLWPDIPLVIMPSPYRSIVGPLLEFLDKTDQEHNDGQLATVLLPEFVPARWWHGLLHNQSAWLIKAALLYRRRNLGFQQVIIDVPYHLER